jgi:hypothetical protein
MATETIQMVSGETRRAQRVRHLRTLGRRDVDLYRTEGGRLVVCTSDSLDGRSIPCVDPDSTPADYGVRED